MPSSGIDPSKVGFSTVELDLHMGGDFAVVAFGKENAFCGLVHGHIGAEETATCMNDMGLEQAEYNE
jgi:hypothetical protein